MKRMLGIGLLLAGSLWLSSSSESGDKDKKKKPADKGLDMRVPFTPLWTGDAPGAKGKEPADIPGVYIYPAQKPNGAAVVVCPGGGYGGLATDHEGVQIADWLNAHGITALVLKYRLGPKYHHPVELGDAQRALRYVRAKATELKVDPNRVGILGFSAGGHLASTAGTHFDPGDKKADELNPQIDSYSCRPDFMVLLYPVITLTGPYTHGGSRNNLLGKNPDPKLIELLSNEKKVTKDTPPTFLAHTSADKGVPPENSVMFYLALSKNKVPAELHIYEKGNHGLGLGPKDLPFSSWPDRCIAWMKGRGLLDPAK
jgi:acetyl esterase/lipase